MNVTVSFSALAIVTWFAKQEIYCDRAIANDMQPER